MEPQTALVNDPLLQISEAVGHAGPMPGNSTEAVEALRKLYSSSADIRACLRLVDPAYFDALSTAHLAGKASSAAEGGDTAEDFTAGLVVVVGAGTRMTRLLLAQALNSSSSSSCDAAAATMLADIIDKHNTASSSSSSSSSALPVVASEVVAQALLTRVRDGVPVVSAHARLLRAVHSNSASNCSYQPLLCTVVDAIVAAPVSTASSATGLAQLLCVAAQVIEHDQRSALAVLASLESLRGFARHVIKLLSVPAPIIAAPALHLLTLILLHPPIPDTAAVVVAGQLQQRQQEQVSPLTILADGLRGKLFDAAHIGRTLVLAADLCLNCQQAAAARGSNNGSSVDDDVVVLDAIAGMVAAIAQCEQSDNSALQAVRAAFFASTELVPAIVHVVAMAKLDRRYLHSVLRMATAILSRPEDATTPLVCALTGESQGPSSSSSSSSFSSDNLPSVIGELLELVLSGIEDVDDAMPLMLLGSEKPKLPRVSSDEAGCCWLANCSASNRRHVAQFLCAVLNCPALSGSGDEAEVWAKLLMEAVSTALEPFFASRTQSEFLPSSALIGRYYWVIKPVLELALDLAAGSLVFRAHWQQYLAQSRPDNSPPTVSAWAATACQDAVSASGGMLSLMYKDIADVFAVPLPSSASASASFLEGIYSQASAKMAATTDKVAAASVATPSDSSRGSSGAASPYQADGEVIAITDMRVASLSSNGGANNESRHSQEELGISTLASFSSATIPSRVQVAVLKQWLRTCEAETALALAAAASPTAVSSQMADIIRQAQMLVVAPPTLLSSALLYSTSTALSDEGLPSPQLSSSAAVLSLVAGVSTAARLYHQHYAYVAALKLSVVQSVQQSHDNLLASTEDELRYLNGELHKAQTRVEQISADLAQTRKQADQWSADHSDLCQAHGELQAKHRKIETDADEWRQECIRTRDHLELSERIARDTHQNLVAQHAAEKQRCVQLAVEANQGAWDRRHAAMSDTVVALERALADAVPRLRALETQAETERLANAELRVQNAAMASKLADMAHAATALHSLAQRPH